MNLLSKEVAESFHVVVIPTLRFVLEDQLETFSGPCAEGAFAGDCLNEILI